LNQSWSSCYRHVSMHMSGTPTIMLVVTPPQV
jgi:hypothetical protein